MVVRVLVVEEVDTKNNLFFLIFVDIGLGFGVLRFIKTYLLFFSAKHDMKHEIVKKYTTRLTCLFIFRKLIPREKKIQDVVVTLVMHGVIACLHLIFSDRITVTTYS